MAELLAMMGGMRQFAARGEKIVLKVNPLQPAKPEQAITTRPAIVATTMGRMAKNRCHQTRPEFLVSYDEPIERIHCQRRI